MGKKIVTKKFLLEKILPFLCFANFYSFLNIYQHELFNIGAYWQVSAWMVEPSQFLLPLISVMFFDG